MMLEGVKINNKHSFNDFKIILEEKEISFPEIERITISIPGRNGILDITDSIYGQPVYKNRPIKLKFVTLNKIAKKTWNELYHQMLNEFHGKEVKVIFDSAPNHYYKGFAKLSNYSTNNDKYSFVIEIDADPYKYNINTNEASL